MLEKSHARFVYNPAYSIAYIRITISMLVVV